MIDILLEEKKKNVQRISVNKKEDEHILTTAKCINIDSAGK